MHISTLNMHWYGKNTVWPQTHTCMLHWVNWLSEMFSLPPQMWFQNCQWELKLQTASLTSCFNFNSWIKLWNSPCCCLLFRTGWTQKFSYLLFLFRNIKTSTSSLNIKFFTVHFLGLIFPRNWMLLVSYMTKSGISCCFSECTQCVMDFRCVL